MFVLSLEFDTYRIVNLIETDRGLAIKKKIETYA